ncbi:MAG: DUF2339 domain-containing protein [Chlorobi bacterium]|nr:DUF2339 domain-containing protein [Chlorobiota bacterium]
MQTANSAKAETILEANAKAKAEQILSQIKQQPPKIQVPKPPKVKSDIEKFIGENLANKVGIIITVIGVAIGAKYAIDHDLISPLTRIILGYLVGLGLMGFAIKLKTKYENFSAVLLSGAIAILYFITFAAYSFYGLFPQLLAFLMMVCFTLFTVLSAIKYNKQIIAHLGLVGAYLVPFLLSDGSGQIGILFSYMVIINVGILIVSVLRDWKPLLYSSFAFSWLIYASWFFNKYNSITDFNLAILFSTLFFIIFYASSIVYKIRMKEKLSPGDTIIMISNAFIFYAFGFGMLTQKSSQELLGLFTLANGVVHFVVAYFIYKSKSGDKSLLYLIIGLVLTFITIAIPVQLNGNWVTLLWIAEALMLFWIGRSKGITGYEVISYFVITIAFFSAIQEWGNYYDTYSNLIPVNNITPIFNVNFLTSILFTIILGFIYYVHKKFNSILTDKNKSYFSIVNVVIPLLFVVSIYFTFSNEINCYFSQKFASSLLKEKSVDGYFTSNYNYDINNEKTIWNFCYTMLFLSIISFVNLKKIKSSKLGILNILLNAFISLIFLIGGLFALSELRDTYITQSLSKFYNRDLFNILIRYVSYLFFGILMYSNFVYSKSEIIKRNLTVVFDIFLITSLLWIMSSELLNIFDLMKVTGSYKLWLSILWGIFSLTLIGVGIIQKKKHIRVMAISIFIITLLKLFLYDIIDLSTIAKTIAFISLGVLLLIISFLYNKYKEILFNDKI